MDYYVDQLPFEFSPNVKQALKSVLYRTVIISDWACGCRDYRSLLSEHWTLAVCALLFAACCCLTLIHAVRHGAQHLYLWLAVFVFGIARELGMVHLFPNGDLQWHGQTFLTFFGRRSPGYVLFCLYPTFLYASTMVVKRLKLSAVPECVLIGAYCTAMRLPYEIIGAKFLWWTWQSDHPFLRVKLFHVPVAMLLMHFWSVVTFHALYRFSQRLLLPPAYDWKLFGRELTCCAMAALNSPMVSYVAFENVFTLLQYLFSNGTIAVLAITHILIVCMLLSHRLSGQLTDSLECSVDELNLATVLLYVSLLTIAAVADPRQVVSVGAHQALGHCGSRQTKTTMLFSTFEIERFVCSKHVDRYEFDFHCVRPQPVSTPRNIQEWYTICGKAMDSREEFMLILCWQTLLIAGIQCYWQWKTKDDGQVFRPAVGDKPKVE